MSKAGDKFAESLALKGFDAHDAWAFVSREDFIAMSSLAFDVIVEHCAKVCEDLDIYNDDCTSLTISQCARKIRALTDDNQ